MPNQLAHQKLETAKLLISEAQVLLSQSNPPPVQPQPQLPTSPTSTTHLRKLAQPGKFYDYLRGTSILGPKISKQEFDGCEAILRHGSAANISLADMAYALATAYHETRATMAPVQEAFWLSKAAREKYLFRMYDIQGARPAKAKELGNIHPGDGVKFGGAGLAQVTGRANAEKLTKALGIDLVNQPERLLELDVAAQAMIYGMIVGLFTGKKFSDYLPRDGRAETSAYVGSRRIINGTDKDDEIAAFADVFEEGLVQGVYA